MLGLDFSMFNVEPANVIEKFRKDIEKETGEPVSTFSMEHVKGENLISIKTPTKVKLIKGGMIAFLIKKGLRMKFKKDVDFEKVLFVYSEKDGSHIVLHTSKGIETQKL